MEMIDRQLFALMKFCRSLPIDRHKTMVDKVAHRLSKLGMEYIIYKEYLKRF